MRAPLALLLFALPLAACADAPDPAEPADPAVAVPSPAPSGPERAVAEIAEVDGSGLSGTVRFTALDDALEVRYQLEGFAADGPHGFHVHQTGDCGADSTGTPAGAAGGHLNPLTSPHGAPSAAPADRHAGDLGNVVVEGGRAMGALVDSVLTLDGPTSVVGKAVIVHAGEDDLASQPSGDAGARIGCGVVGAPAAAGAAGGGSPRPAG